MSDSFNEADVQGSVEALEIEMKAFLVDAKKFTNKAAARRARKSSIEIGDLLKKFRKLSIK